MVEHPTPECTLCGGEKTRPLNEKAAVCFGCGNEWLYEEDYSDYWSRFE